MRTIALIMAAGRGTRCGGELPKQYQLLAGKPLLRHAVLAFLAHPAIDAVRVIIHPDDETLYRQAIAGLEVLAPVHGGSERQDSVRRGLQSLAEYMPEYVLIHDAARPLVSARIINDVARALEYSTAVIPVISVADTVKKWEGGIVTATLDRQKLVLAQTPQGFRYAPLCAALEHVTGIMLTDEAMLCEQAGIPVATVTGEMRNFKITVDEDMERAAHYVAWETRTGIGVDAHRFSEGSGTIMLCGVAVPHTHGLEAHSDGDVGLHALVDALLGTIGAGDIGLHFPPTDDRWKNADSSVFLAHAYHLVQQKGGYINNLDVVIIGEAPKISPYRQAMVERIAAILGVDIGRVNVKATTTEKMGFTGRKEGLAAQASVTISIPVSHQNVPANKGEQHE